MRGINSDRESLDPVEDSVVSELRSPLRGHVASAVNGSESEFSVVTGLNVSTNLAINEILLPVIGDGPVSSFNPCLGSVGADNHVSITRVLKDLILVLKSLVNFKRSTRIPLVVSNNIIVAKIPLLHSHRNVKLSSHGIIVKISKSRLGVYAGRNQILVRDKRSIVCSCEVILLLTDTRGSVKILLNEARIYLRLRNSFLILPANTESIIDIDVKHSRIKHISVEHASRA